MYRIAVVVLSISTSYNNNFNSCTIVEKKTTFTNLQLNYRKKKITGNKRTPTFFTDNTQLL